MSRAQSSMKKSADMDKLEEFLGKKCRESEVEHETIVSDRFDRYVKIFMKFLKEKEGEDLTLDDFIMIEEMYYAKFKEFEEGMAVTGINAYFEGRTRAESRKRHRRIKKLAEDENAFDAGLALSIFGTSATIIQIIHHFKNKYAYIPLWKKGKNDIQKSYKFSSNTYTKFMRYMNNKSDLPDIGLLFGISRQRYVNIKAVIPLDEFIKGAKKLLPYTESKILADVLEEIREDIRADQDNKKCATALQKLAVLMFDRMDTRELIRKIPMKGLGKTYLRRNSPKLRFLGAYYYNKDLLSHEYEIDKIIDKFADEKHEPIQQFRLKINSMMTKLKKGLEMKGLATTPKFLFFEKKTQFKKVDNILKGLIPYFMEKSGRLGEFHGLPILVCIDKANNDMKRFLCIAYRKEEGIYKRLKYYG